MPYGPFRNITKMNHIIMVGIMTLNMVLFSKEDGLNVVGRLQIQFLSRVISIWSIEYNTRYDEYRIDSCKKISKNLNIKGKFDYNRN
jgi:hypothetical protein